MKLSEAIRLGAMLKPQGFGMLFDGEGTCANGAALDACGLLAEIGTHILKNRFPIVEVQAERCFVCEKYMAKLAFSTTLGGLVAHLNDDHKWTRERIADWVESQEALAEASSVAAIDPVGEAVTS